MIFTGLTRYVPGLYDIVHLGYRINQVDIYTVHDIVNLVDIIV